MEFFTAYITAADEAQAKRLAEGLVGQGLAACVNIFPSVQSIYRWKGAVESASESVLLAKILGSHREQVIDYVRREHSYQVPCVVFYPIDSGNPDYLQWVASECSGPAALKP